MHYHNLIFDDDNDNSDTPISFSKVSSHRVAWLQQHDTFFEQLTIQETLDLAVFFEWSQLSIKDRHYISQSCLESLGLASIQNRRVGSAIGGSTKAMGKKGSRLSGGERRRLSVALELVVCSFIDQTWFFPSCTLGWLLVAPICADPFHTSCCINQTNMYCTTD